ncbi:hypothetical protein RYA05_00455 [Pseudomonas syringae pv. actinidiae]|nr:hypothetical protein [Pseudomonas syringae pv. actinidiae]
MEISSHHMLITLDEKGMPFVYVVYEPAQPVREAKVALESLRQGTLDRRPKEAMVSLHLDSRVTVEANLTMAVKAHLNEHPQGMLAMISVHDLKSFEKALISRLSDDVSHSLKREKELLLTPQMRSDMREQRTIVDSFMRTNPNFLDDAIRRKWIHKLTGLLLIEGEQKLINAEMIPLWARLHIQHVQVVPLSIYSDERLIINNQ